MDNIAKKFSAPVGFGIVSLAGLADSIKNYISQDLYRTDYILSIIAYSLIVATEIVIGVLEILKKRKEEAQLSRMIQLDQRINDAGTVDSGAKINQVGEDGSFLRRKLTNVEIAFVLENDYSWYFANIFSWLLSALVIIPACAVFILELIEKPQT